MRKPITKICENCFYKFQCYRKEGVFCSSRCSGIKIAEKRIRITLPEKFCLTLNECNSSNECWIWPKGKDRKGYGQFRYGKKGAYKAHRVSYLIFNGEIPPAMFVCHTCDNPPCVNPEHLFTGTPRDNTRDMIKKGRDKLSSLVHKNERLAAKLTIEEVLEIRRKHLNEKIPLSKLAKIYNVTHNNIWCIIKRMTWKDI